MSSNAQKTPFARQLHQFGDDKSTDWLQRDPKRMPATVTKVEGPIITVKIEGKWNPFNIPEIKIPKAESEWAREPTQVGDKGLVVVGDFYLGQQSGLGGGAADLYPRANLTNAVFQPLSNKGWSTVNQDQYNVSGKAGVKSQTKDGLSYVDIQENTIKIFDKNGNKIVELIDGDIAIYIWPVEGKKLYLGGDGHIGGYDFVLTNSGPSINVKARIS